MLMPLVCGAGEPPPAWAITVASPQPPPSRTGSSPSPAPVASGTRPAMVGCVDRVDDALHLDQLGGGLDRIRPRLLGHLRRLAAAIALAQAGVEISAPDADRGRAGLDPGRIGRALGDQAGDGAKAPS